jgi:CheY-like chemotaxis protein
VVSTVQPLVEQNNNTLVVRSDNRTGLMYADVTKVRQVLLNLLSNAAKFTKNGRITLTIGREKRDGQEWMCFQVADTGIGMTPEQVRNLFQAFTQADASTTRKYGGTGLGLALSRHLCLMMGGDLAATSEYGSGSTFTVRLPALSAEQVGESESLAAPTSESGASSPQLGDTNEWVGSLVLVIDDDPAVNDMLTRILTDAGFLVETATSGEEGRRRAQEIRPDIIILDVLLPDEDGWNVLASLKSDADLAEVPVIVQTIVDSKDRALRLGAAGYLLKPIDQQRLIALLKKHQPIAHGVALLDRV